MIRAIASLGLVGLFVAAGVAQTQPVPKGALKSDYTIVIRELDKAASKRLGMKESAFAGGEGTIKREELISDLDMLFGKYQAKFRVTPRPFDVYPEVIDKHNSDPKIRESLRKLSRWGMIGPVSKLVASESPELTEDELGDMIGYFYTRVMTYTHQPDPAWTPDLQGE